MSAWLILLAICSTCAALTGCAAYVLTDSRLLELGVAKRSELCLTFAMFMLASLISFTMASL